MTIFHILEQYNIPFNIQVLCNFYLYDVAMQIKKDSNIYELKVNTFKEFLKLATNENIDSQIINQIISTVVNSY